MLLNTTPVTAVGSPTRTMARTVASAGTPKATMRRRTRITMPMRNATARVKIVAIGRSGDAEPRRRPQPENEHGVEYERGDRRIRAREKNGVRVSPAARNAASIAKKPIDQRGAEQIRAEVALAERGDFGGVCMIPKSVSSCRRSRARRAPRPSRRKARAHPTRRALPRRAAARRAAALRPPSVRRSPSRRTR